MSIRGRARLGARGGHLLAEALCALALAGLLAMVAAVALGAARRALTTTERVARTERAGREAVAVIAGLLRDADLVMVEGDTAIALAVLIASGSVCATEPRALTLPSDEVLTGTVPGAASFTRIAEPLDAGDLVTVLVVDSLAGAGRWIGTRVDSVTSRVAASPCVSTDGWGTAAGDASPRIRLVLADSLPDEIPRGAPVRVWRRGRLALYHAGAGEWMIGWRRCDASGAICGATQPVAGPLRSAADGGFRVRYDPVVGLYHLEARGASPARSVSLDVGRRDAP